MRIPKTAVYTTVSVLALLLLFVGGGLAYVWYTGQNTPEVATVDSTPTADTSERRITPTKPAANAQASASVQMLTTPVAPGENASISVKTVATSTCSIKVEYNNVPGIDSGLITKTADEFGIISWTWTVDASAPQGTWPVTVTCTYNGRAAVVRGDLQVAVPAS